ncbi:MAG: hypothetical protein L0220_34255, partial [Acidobacteria bacterium]|nr:hypothetical protein [Acidobacteriota bacterium]
DFPGEQADLRATINLGVRNDKKIAALQMGFNRDPAFQGFIFMAQIKAQLEWHIQIPVRRLVTK